MCDELFVLIDEADFCTKDQAVHLIALYLAHRQALGRGLSSITHPQTYAEFVFPRRDEIEKKLRAIIAIGPP